MKNNLGMSLLLVLMMLLTIFGILYVCFGSVGKSSADLPRMEPLTATFTSDGDSIKAYVLVDPDTGIQYLVSDHGGVTPRLKD